MIEWLRNHVKEVDADRLAELVTWVGRQRASDPTVGSAGDRWAVVIAEHNCQVDITVADAGTGARFALATVAGALADVVTLDDDDAAWLRRFEDVCAESVGAHDYDWSPAFDGGAERLSVTLTVSFTSMGELFKASESLTGWSRLRANL